MSAGKKVFTPPVSEGIGKNALKMPVLLSPFQDLPVKRLEVLP